jgi:hypothetical protein
MRLFRQNANIKRQLIEALRNNDTGALAAVRERFDTNADRIAAALNRTNTNLNEAELAAMLKTQNNDFITLAQYIMRDEWSQDVVAYDKIVDDALKIADALVVGFRASFPERVTVTVVVQNADGTIVNSGTVDTNAGDQTGDDVVGDEVELTSDDIAMHLAMREVFSDHVMYEKFFTMSGVGELRGSQAFADRLMINADELGEKLTLALRLYENQTPPDFEGLQRLFRQHVTIGAQVLGAAMRLNELTMAADGTRRDGNHSDDASQAESTRQALAEARAVYREAISRWRDNADAIASVLAESNVNYDEDNLRGMLREHIDLMLEMIEARIAENWVADIAAYDQLVPHVYELADVLSEGIMQLRLNQAGDSSPDDSPCHDNSGKLVY